MHLAYEHPLHLDRWDWLLRLLHKRKKALAKFCTFRNFYAYYKDKYLHNQKLFNINFFKQKYIQKTV